MKKVVVMGGGTGLSSIIRGIKRLPIDLYAIVSMADDGGSSGLLRKDLNLLPPGDLRNCLLALSEAKHAQMNELFNYRFTQGSLEGHSLGNLILAALEDINGGMEKAVSSFSQIFNIKGTVYPVTLESINIKAVLEGGKEVFGESMIPRESLTSGHQIDHINLVPMRPRAYAKAKEALLEADLILVGPGSLYTSILPALLVSGIKESILQSGAKCYLVGNLMTQPGETTGYRLMDHHKKIIDHLEDEIFDGIVVNQVELQDKQKKMYQEKLYEQIIPTKEDVDYFKKKGIKMYFEDLVDVNEAFIRHDREKIKRAVKRLLEIK